MRLICAMQSPVGRVLETPVGGWLLLEGVALNSAAGIAMMMAGLVLVVTGVAGFGIGGRAPR